VLVGLGVGAAAPGVLYYFLAARGAEPPAGQAPGGAGPRTIAVLPFVNMSGDQANEYFSDGISEEILNVLAQTPELRVAARTSSFSFKGQHKEIPAIAHELGVRMVLEGSVRKQGGRVRITAQLVDASSGFHLWSETFDRELLDIFAIQDEIARAIAAQLRVKLGGKPEASRAPVDLEAYDLYLRGLALWQSRGQANIDEAERLFRKAIERDPRFAKAWAGLALAENVRSSWFGLPAEAATVASRDAAEHALALDPELPEAYAVLGGIAYSEGRDETGRALYERALTIAPSYATAWQWYGESLVSAGRAEEAIEKGRRAAELDPRSPVVRSAYASGLFSAGRDADAERVCDATLADAPEWQSCLLLKWDILMLRKDYDGARAVLRRLAVPRGEASVRFADELMDGLAGRGDVRALATRLLPMPDGFFDQGSPAPLADFDAMLWFMAVGRTSDALTRLERFASSQVDLVRIAVADRHLDGLRCEPRFQAVARQIGFIDGRAAELCRGKEPRANDGGHGAK
jgi:TolB-like protein/Tfp pilus assembly protein PilF